VLSILCSAALATAFPAQQIDSTVPVERGQRLEVNAYAGDLAVSTWNRNAVRVEGESSGRTGVEISRSGSIVEVRTESRRGPAGMTDLKITVPAWLPLTLSGVHTDVAVTGTRAPVTVETVQGDVTVEGGEGLISLQSVEGQVSVRGAKGRIELHSVNEDVVIEASSGDVTAETVNGEITLEQVDAASLAASTVNGDIQYVGPIRSGGRYSLSSHNGDLTLTVPEGASASVAVSTFNGEFESEFPVTLTDTRKGKRFSFTLGSGSAQVSLESFQGTIQLVRPGSRLVQPDEDDE
jgi:DUF4097 and DUF4098 domain-containing protein YvlB